MANRLARESSPYLLLHKDNPVDWYPWGEEAFARARAEDKPIFLSVGYSTCYWCHVMERESFSDARDRPGDERRLRLRQGRPRGAARRGRDLHGRHAAHHARRAAGPTRSSSPPTSSPSSRAPTSRRPTRRGRPGFPRVLQGLREAWLFRRPELLQQARDGGAGDASSTSPRPAGGRTPCPARTLAERRAGRPRRPLRPRVGRLRAGAQVPLALEPLLPPRAGRRATRRARCSSRRSTAWPAAASWTSSAGGFHRYSTDEAWLVPHFEKMLYDNASLAWLYAEASALAPGAGLRPRGPPHPRLRPARDDRTRGGLPLRDRRRDGRPRGRLLHVDGGGARRRPARARRGGSSARSTASTGRRTFEGERYVLYLHTPLAEQARTGGALRGGAAAPARAGPRGAPRGARAGASGRSPTTRSSPTGTA